MTLFGLNSPLKASYLKSFVQTALSNGLKFINFYQAENLKFLKYLPWIEEVFSYFVRQNKSYL